LNYWFVFYVLIDKRKPITGMGLMEFVMSDQKEIAIILKSSKVQIMGCSYALPEGVKVDGNQAILDAKLKAQHDYYNGVNVCSGNAVSGWGL
jgi:hypothetical protein